MMATSGWSMVKAISSTQKTEKLYMINEAKCLDEFKLARRKFI